MPKHLGVVGFTMLKRLSQRAVNRQELRQARKTQVTQTRMRRNGKLKGEFTAVVVVALLLGVAVVSVALLLGVMGGIAED